MHPYGISGTGTHMKTAVEISHALAREATEIARREEITVRELIETGLRAVLRERQRKTGFRLRDVSFGGNGLQAEFRGASWERLREAA